MYRCATSSPTMLLKTQHIEHKVLEHFTIFSSQVTGRSILRLATCDLRRTVKLKYAARNLVLTGKCQLVKCGMAMMIRLGAKVRALRKQRGLTQREVADMVGVHYTHIQKIEAGRKRPSSDMILKFAQLFGVSADQLMRDDLDVMGSGHGGDI